MAMFHQLAVRPLHGGTCPQRESLAGDARDVLNRSYKGKTITASNTSDLDLIKKTKEAMYGKPVIISLYLTNPTVVEQFEQDVQAIVANFGVQDQAVLDILVGAVEPSGLLPLQMPKDMKTVEEQYEDIPHDMNCYVDSEGNTYDFAFGLNWEWCYQRCTQEKYRKN